MGGGYSQSESSQHAGTAPAKIMENYAKFLPQFSQLTLGQISPTTGAIAGAGLEAVRGAGGQLANEISSLADTTNPSLALANQATRGGINALGTASGNVAGANAAAASAVDAARRGLGAINLSGLSPGEYAAVERSLNNTLSGTGNLGLDNPMNTISNAMNFGGAFNNKLGLYNNAVNSLVGAANTATGAANAAGGIAGEFGNLSNAASNTAATKTGAMAGMNAIANPSALGTTTNLGNMGLLEQIAQGNRSTGSSSSLGVQGPNCCFIFLEAYHGTMPESIRRFRDKYYRLRPSIAVGYKKMAKWLVPWMQKSTTVNNLVWKWMVLPATLHSIHPTNNWNKRISHFWLKFWAIYGKI